MKRIEIGLPDPSNEVPGKVDPVNGNTSTLSNKNC